MHVSASRHNLSIKIKPHLRISIILLKNVLCCNRWIEVKIVNCSILDVSITWLYDVLSKLNKLITLSASLDANLGVSNRFCVRNITHPLQFLWFKVAHVGFVSRVDVERDLHLLPFYHNLLFTRSQEVLVVWNVFRWKANPMNWFEFPG